MSEERGAGILSDGIARTLRLGTIITIAFVAVGYVLALAGGEPGPGPLPMLELLGGGGSSAIIGIGLLGLTFVPVAVLGVAAVGFRMRGEHRMLTISVLVAVLLLATLAAAIVLAPPS
jgi:uncharacterized membrane protein